MFHFFEQEKQKKKTEKKAQKKRNKEEKKKDKRIKIKLQKMKKRRGESKMRFKKFAIKEEEGGRLARSLGRAILWDNQTGDHVWQSGGKADGTGSQCEIGRDA